jgi:hypothetical protein
LHFPPSAQACSMSSRAIMRPASGRM